jgi:hypothetical protein
MSKYLQPAKTAHSGKGQLAAVKDLLTNAFPDVFVLTTDDFKEAGLTPWYDAMKSKVCCHPFFGNTLLIFAEKQKTKS